MKVVRHRKCANCGEPFTFETTSGATERRMNTAIEGPRHCENCKPVECPACGQDVWDRDIGYDKGHLIHGKFIVESRVELRSPKVTCHNCGERYSEESV